MLLVAIALGPAFGQPAVAPFRYPENKFGPARLQYIQGLPVLEVRGTPTEMGNQVARLALQPARQILDYPQDFLKQANMQIAWPLLKAACNAFGRNIPRDYAQELDGLAEASGQPRELFVVANTMFDILGGLGCSTLIVDSERSTTQEPLFGRNLDFPTLVHCQTQIFGLPVRWVARPKSVKGVAIDALAQPRPSKTQGVPPEILALTEH
jgi:hypothetical protein